MTKEEYYKKSIEQNLPLRCPCLNNCIRYRETAYYVGSTCYKPKSSNFETALREMGILGNGEDINKMLNAGEPVTMIGGSRSFGIYNGCPEFFLHPHEHKLVGMKDQAVHQYSYDEEYTVNKCRPGESRHYTECPEYALFTSKKTRVKSDRKRISLKTKANLQKEINSQCPICTDDNVGHFEIHHLDEDRTNNKENNLLMLCRNCHSKFTKGDISIEQGKEIKAALINGIANIKCASINVDSSVCSWKRYEIPNAFYDERNEKSRFPILQFAIINNSKQTVLFTEIEVKAKYLPRGISGMPTPAELKPIATYRILLPEPDSITRFQLQNEIVVQQGNAFKFSTELYSHWDSEDYPPEGRVVLHFTFRFNDNIQVSAPAIYLNCKSDDPTMTITIIS